MKKKIISFCLAFAVIVPAFLNVPEPLDIIAASPVAVISAPSALVKLPEDVLMPTEAVTVPVFSPEEEAIMPVPPPAETPPSLTTVSPERPLPSDITVPLLVTLPPEIAVPLPLISTSAPNPLVTLPLAV